MIAGDKEGEAIFLGIFRDTFVSLILISIILIAYVEIALP